MVSKYKNNKTLQKLIKATVIIKKKKLLHGCILKKILKMK